MKNILIIFVFLVFCLLFQRCTDGGMIVSDYYVKNLTNKSVILEFFFYPEKKSYSIQIPLNSRKKIDFSLEICPAGAQGHNMCADSVKVTFEDGKIKTDRICPTSGTYSDPRVVECMKDSVNLLYDTYIENPNTYVFYVRDSDYNEAK